MDEPTARGHNDAGVRHYLAGRPVQAEAEYRAALDLDPDDPAAHNNLGFLLAKAQRWGEALTHLRRAADLAPGDATALANLGQALAASGDIESGLAQLARATSLDPADALAWDNLGRVRLLAGDPAGAETAWARACALVPLGEPGGLRLRRRLATALAARGRSEEAIATLDLALKSVASPPSPPGRGAKGEGANAHEPGPIEPPAPSQTVVPAGMPGPRPGTGVPDGANEFAPTAKPTAASGPSPAVVPAGMPGPRPGTVDQRHTTPAEEPTNPAPKTHPDAPDQAGAWALLGTLLFLRQDQGSAKAALDRALALDPNHRDALRHLGLVQVATGQPAAARETYERLVAADPSNREARVDLAVLLLSAGDPGGALAQLTAPEIDAGGPEDRRYAFYHALALTQTGEREAGLSRLAALTASGGEYTHQAAQVIRSLSRQG